MLSVHTVHNLLIIFANNSTIKKQFKNISRSSFLVRSKVVGATFFIIYLGYGEKKNLTNFLKTNHPLSCQRRRNVISPLYMEFSKKTQLIWWIITSCHFKNKLDILGNAELWIITIIHDIELFLLFWVIFLS